MTIENFITVVVIVFVVIFLLGWKRGWLFKQILIAILCLSGLVALVWLLTGGLDYLGSLLEEVVPWR